MPKKSNNSGKGNAFRDGVSELLRRSYLQEPRDFIDEGVPKAIARALNDTGAPFFDPKDEKLSPARLLLDYFRLLDRNDPPYEFCERVETAMLGHRKLRNTGVLTLLMLTRKAPHPLVSTFVRKAVAHYCLNSIQIIRRFESKSNPIVMHDKKEGSPFRNLLMHVFTVPVDDGDAAELSVDAKGMGIEVAKEVEIPNASHGWVREHLPIGASVTISIDELKLEPALKHGTCAESVARFFGHAPFASDVALQLLGRKYARRKKDGAQGRRRNRASLAHSAGIGSGGGKKSL